MTDKHLHIVAFDLPYPPNYGGSTDMYYKVLSMKELGVKITLHVFLYGGKSPAKELEAVADKVYYYPRKRRNPFAGTWPYIVRTRKSVLLLKRLMSDDSPILFEGLHTTYYCNSPQLINRVRVVRAHNVEHNYYEALALAEENIVKTLFFKHEAKRLRDYEKMLKQVNGVAGISPMETRYLQGEYGNAEYIPAFHSNEEMICKTGKGEYVLYHGNLSVPENNRAALFLVTEVFSRLSIPCYVAGSRPSQTLQETIKRYPNIKLVANVSAEEILKLIQEAHINVMVTFQSTGIKLKLLNSLYRGRFVVANKEMVDETGLDTLVHLGQTPAELVQQIQNVMNMEFTEDLLDYRKQVLGSTFNNQLNARKLLGMLGL